jgi:excisionase family DNA binding protein
MDNKIFVRPSEVARQLGVSRSTVYRWFWEGKLQGVKFSDRSLRILVNSVEKMISKYW